MASKRKTASELTSQPDPRAPLDRPAFLTAARRVLAKLSEDLLQRADGSSALTEGLRVQWEAETKAERTADAYEVWRRRYVGQVAAAWLLSVVFVRVLEDRGLVDRNRIAGPGATDSQRQFFDLAPYLSERDYLLTVFRELAALPAGAGLFDPKHNLAFRISPSADGAKALLELFRSPTAEAPAFRFGEPETYFLGDLYQDLDEDVRSRFALLQTPKFVAEFILDRTLEPAIEEFGLDDTTVLDPTCGSGHFLLAAFERLFEHRLRKEPGLDVRVATGRAIAAIFGVDLNPYAVSIARFRLTVACLDKGGYAKLKDAPKLPDNVIVADALLHGAPGSGQAHLGDAKGTKASQWKGAAFALDDEDRAKAVLSKGFAAVVGNPPYITVKDAALRERYRRAYTAAAGKYALSAPFAERFFQLARKDGFVGQITANSFMKREFGKPLVEKVLSKLDLSLIVNTSGAYIPGHGTPTVLLFGRNRIPTSPQVCAVLAKRGEPQTPADAARGEVWTSIAEHWSDIGFENAYVSVARVLRENISKHPWSLGGGGATELKELLEQRAESTLGDIASAIGISAVTGEDDVFLLPVHAAVRLAMEVVRPMVIGEEIRDWATAESEVCLFPYDASLALQPLERFPNVSRLLWRVKAVISRRKRFGTPMLERGLTWYELQELYADKLRTPLSIAFAEVATHNHFVLDRGGKVFNRTAPIIKLPATATEEDHLALLAYLNSSTACFWMKQVSYPKATAVGDISTDKGREEANRYQFAGTALRGLPLPRLTTEQRKRVIAYAQTATTLAERRESMSARACVDAVARTATPWRAMANSMSDERANILEELKRIQEDIDWTVYAAYGLVAAPPVSEAYSLNSKVQPADLSADLQRQRAEAVRHSPELHLLEQAVYKRPWTGRRGVFGHSAGTFEEELVDQAYAFISDAAEKSLGTEPASLRAMAARLASDARIRRVAEIAAPGEEPEAGVRAVLAASDAIPFLAAYRLTETGLEKRRQWERVWDLQRREEAGEDVGPIPVPPKYDSKDFRDQNYWRLRGKLDVPKERFISYPGCESDEDGEPVYGWAGWNHLQQAQALAALYVARKDNEGWETERLVPMLAGLDELVPWIKQWHNELNPEYGQRLGDFFDDYVAAQCTALGIKRAELREWRPTAKRSAARKKAAAPVVTPADVPSSPAPATSGPRLVANTPKRRAPKPSEPPPAPAPLAKTRGGGRAEPRRAAGRRRRP